jgi:hypothetical protein
MRASAASRVCEAFSPAFQEFSRLRRSEKPATRNRAGASEVESMSRAATPEADPSRKPKCRRRSGVRSLEKDAILIYIVDAGSSGLRRLQPQAHVVDRAVTSGRMQWSDFWQVPPLSRHYNSRRDLVNPECPRRRVSALLAVSPPFTPQSSVRQPC